MKKYKLNWRFWFFVILFGGIQPLGYRVLYMLYNNQIVDENDQALGEGVSMFMCLAIGLVLFTYLISVINLLRVYIKNKGEAFTLTENGIENTFVIMNFFAIFLVFPVKCIPWNSIKTIIKADDLISLRVNKKEVNASLPAKTILFISGYSFCKGFVKPYVTYESIEQYNKHFSADIKVIKEENDLSL